MAHIYSLLDRIGNTFGHPISLDNDAVAVRHVRDFVTQKGTVIANHPGDFELHRLASWDPTTGKIVPEPMPDLVVRLSSLVVADV